MKNENEKNENEKKMKMKKMKKNENKKNDNEKKKNACCCLPSFANPANARIWIRPKSLGSSSPPWISLST